MQAGPQVAEPMIFIPGGTFAMGSDSYYPEEAPVHPVAVDGFWIDRTPVTNAAFAGFVSATGYVTLAEKPPRAEDYPGADPAMLQAGSLVFTPPRHAVPLNNPGHWWRFVFGACWSAPEGPGSDLAGRGDHPVVHIAQEDARAYAAWAGKELPTEAEWEFAARGGLKAEPFAWGNELAPKGKIPANIWQGPFPHQRSGPYARTSPVGAFPPNGYGLSDMIGNVWEWTADYFIRHSAPAAKACCIPENPRHTDPAAASWAVAGGPVLAHFVVKGGSHLCAPEYCQRYRPAARQAQAIDSSTSHIGFRCIRRGGEGGSHASP